MGLEEHIQVPQLGNVTQLEIAHLCAQSGDKFDLSRSCTLDIMPQKHQRLFLEALHSKG